MKTTTMIATKTLLLLAAVTAMDPAAAATIGEIGKNWAESFRGLGSAGETFCWMMAIFCIVMCGMKFKAYADNPDRESLAKPLWLFAIAGIFAAVPTVLESATTSTFGKENVVKSKPGGNNFGF